MVGMRLDPLGFRAVFKIIRWCLKITQKWWMIAIQWRTIKGAIWIVDVSGHLIKCPETRSYLEFEWVTSTNCEFPKNGILKFNRDIDPKKVRSERSFFQTRIISWLYSFNGKFGEFLLPCLTLPSDLADTVSKIDGFRSHSPWNCDSKRHCQKLLSQTPLQLCSRWIFIVTSWYSSLVKQSMDKSDKSGFLWFQEILGWNSNHRPYSLSHQWTSTAHLWQMMLRTRSFSRWILFRGELLDFKAVIYPHGWFWTISGCASWVLRKTTQVISCRTRKFIQLPNHNLVGCGREREWTSNLSRLDNWTPTPILFVTSTSKIYSCTPSYHI